jgi:calcineurin-like phosphoesterase family protein
MDIWFTSDTHFGHKNIIQYANRPFDSVEQMDEVMVQRWNHHIKPNDLVFHLGDLFFYKGEMQQKMIPRLHGRKILIRGNHDDGYTNSKFRALGFEPKNQYVFEDYLLTHYPQTQDAMLELIDQTHIKGNLHGHVHDRTDHLNKDVMRCMCVEQNNYYPFHLDEIRRYFK